jgi:hypothetical protein
VEVAERRILVLTPTVSPIRFASKEIPLKRIIFQNNIFNMVCWRPDIRCIPNFDSYSNLNTPSQVQFFIALTRLSSPLNPNKKASPFLVCKSLHLNCDVSFSSLTVSLKKIRITKVHYKLFFKGYFLSNIHYFMNKTIVLVRKKSLNVNGFKGLICYFTYRVFDGENFVSKKSINKNILDFLFLSVGC